MNASGSRRSTIQQAPDRYPTAGSDSALRDGLEDEDVIDRQRARGMVTCQRGP